MKFLEELKATKARAKEITNFSYVRGKQSLFKNDGVIDMALDTLKLIEMLELAIKQRDEYYIASDNAALQRIWEQGT